MQVIEQLGQMSSNKKRLVSLGQDVQEIGRRDEVESRESETFCLEVLCQRFLAQRESVLEEGIVSDIYNAISSCANSFII